MFRLEGISNRQRSADFMKSRISRTLRSFFFGLTYLLEKRKRTAAVMRPYRSFSRYLKQQDVPGKGAGHNRKRTNKLAIQPVNSTSDNAAAVTTSTTMRRWHWQQEQR